MGLKGKYSNNQSDQTRAPSVTYNSLDFTVASSRVATFQSTAAGIYLYGTDNNYPYKIMNLAKRSGFMQGVLNAKSKFIAGRGFPGATVADAKSNKAVVINRQGQTLYDLLKFCAWNKANINIAIHVNFNTLGEAVEFTPVQYDFVRKKIKILAEDYDKYIITNVFHLEQNNHNFGASIVTNFNKWMDDKKFQPELEALEVYAYNPDPGVVRDQIAQAGGIEKYGGQLFYIKNTPDIYQEAIYDSVVDSFQFLSEESLMSLSNLQNGYSAGGFYKHLGDVDDNKEVADLKKTLANSRGPINAGRIHVVGIPKMMADKMPQHVFEPTVLPNFDRLSVNQHNNAEKAIQALFGVPLAILGLDTQGNFSTQDFQLAFDDYNAKTYDSREELSINLTTLISNSVFAKDVKLPIEIEPIEFISSEASIDDNEAIRRESQAKLKGTVGGVQGVLEVQRAVSEGVTQYDSGIAILEDIYGYETDKAERILGEPIKQFSDNEETVDDADTKTTKTNKKDNENETTDND